MFTKLCQKLFVKVVTRGLRRKTVAVSNWVKTMPPELEAVVFTPGGRAVFLRSPEAPSTDLAILEQLYAPENEDLLAEMTKRFRERRVH